MAIKIYEKFAPRANPADGDYPYGSLKNESVPGAKDGTPLDAAWGNDYAGSDAELFAQAGIVPSGEPDKLGVSQRVDAMFNLFGRTVDSIKDLGLVTNPSDKSGTVVNGFYVDSSVGGGLFIWDDTKDKATHNGGTVLDPIRVLAWDGTFGDLATLYTVGVGSGCFVKVDGNTTVDSFGAVDSTVSDIDVVLTQMEAAGVGTIVANTLTYKTENFIPATDALSFAGSAQIQTKAGHTFNISVCMENKVGAGEPIRMAYTDTDWDWGTCSYLKSKGINTIMSFGLFAESNQLLLLRSVIAAKMQIMAYSNEAVASLPQLITDYANVIAFYIYDEPDAQAIPVAAQDARVLSYKAVTNKPIACSAVLEMEMTRLVSDKFDIIFLQHYYTEGALSSKYLTDTIDRNNTVKGVVLQGSYLVKHPSTKLIPVIGLFTHAAYTLSVSKIDNYAKAVAGLSDDGSCAMFVWGGTTDPSIISSPKSNNDLLKVLNKLISFTTSAAKVKITPVIFTSDNDYAEFGAITSSANLMSNTTPTVKNVKPFSVKNVGGLVDEFNSNFHEQGLAAKDAGGYILLDTASYDCSGMCHMKSVYRDIPDGSSATVGLAVSANKGFTVTDIINVGVANNAESQFWISRANTPAAINGHSILIKLAPSVANANHWKFLIGQLYLSNWEDVVY